MTKNQQIKIAEDEIQEEIRRLNIRKAELLNELKEATTKTAYKGKARYITYVGNNGDLVITEYDGKPVMRFSSEELETFIPWFVEYFVKDEPSSKA